jgi:hypothetical protein
MGADMQCVHDTRLGAWELQQSKNARFDEMTVEAESIQQIVAECRKRIEDFAAAELMKLAAELPDYAKREEPNTDNINDGIDSAFEGIEALLEVQVARELEQLEEDAFYDYDDSKE